VWLSICDVQEEAIWLDYTGDLLSSTLGSNDQDVSSGYVRTYLVNILFRVSSYHVRRIPQTATDHGIECAFVDGDADAVAGDVGHAADVLFEPAYGRVLE